MSANDNPAKLPSVAELDAKDDSELNALRDALLEAWEASPDDPVPKANFDRLQLYMDRRNREQFS